MLLAIPRARQTKSCHFAHTGFSLAASVASAIACACLFPHSLAHAEEASAETTNDAYTFTQQVVMRDTVMRKGEQTRIDVILRCENADEYPMYAYSTTLCLDATVLRIDSLEARSGVDAYTREQSFSSDGQGKTNIVVNFLSRKLSGSVWQQEEVVLSLLVTPQSAGPVTVETSRVNVSNETGMLRLPCTCVDFSTVIDEPLPLAVLNGSYTSVNDFALVSYEGEIPAGFVPCYANQPFVWNGSQFVMLIGQYELSCAKRSEFALLQRESPQIALMDANGNGVVTIVDAQIAYDAACGVFVDFSVLPLTGWLSCDANQDGVLDASDAFAIQSVALTA